mmetsp:Transcript_7572/g.20270  ORF Transcript_7572/g.20270 Transcript_7572/m.20270 type:complete len:261 (-) Transcript_7572:176-958(-)
MFFAEPPTAVFAERACSAVFQAFPAAASMATGLHWSGEDALSLFEPPLPSMSRKKSVTSGSGVTSPAMYASAKPMPGSRSTRSRNRSECTIRVTSSAVTPAQARGPLSPSPKTRSSPFGSTMRRSPCFTRPPIPRQSAHVQRLPSREGATSGTRSCGQESIGAPSSSHTSRAERSPSSWKPYWAQAPAKKMRPPIAPWTCRSREAPCSKPSAVRTGWPIWYLFRTRASSSAPAGGFTVTKSSRSSSAPALRRTPCSAPTQ